MHFWSWSEKKPVNWDFAATLVKAAFALPLFQIDKSFPDWALTTLFPVGIFFCFLVDTTEQQGPKKDNFRP